MKDLTELKKCPLFNEKTLNEIYDLLEKLHYRINLYSKNETIFSPLMVPDSLGIVLSGTVDVLKNYPSGKSLLITRKSDAELLGEETLYTWLKEYPEYFVASSDCEILMIKKEALTRLIAEDPIINMNFIKAISESAILVKKSYGVLTLSSIQEKIAGYLYHEYIRTHSLKIILPYSKKQWAEHLNLSRTSLSRELRELASSEVIEFDAREITIIDFEKLKSILHI